MHTPTDHDRRQFRNVWVVAEQREGVLKDVTFELLGAARRLARQRRGEVWCVLLGHGVRRMSQACLDRGADAVVLVDDPRLEHFVDDVYATVLHRLVERHRPEIVLCGATARGRALIPRVAVSLTAGLTADCTGLDIEEGTGVLLQTRPAFGGNIMATIKCTDYRPQMATVRPRVMSAMEPQPGRTGRVLVEPFPENASPARLTVLEAVTDARETVHLADAKFIVAGGRGMGGREAFKLLAEFAALVEGAVGASRAAVDAGWVDYAHQVGQTGQTVQPKVYMACGISGQVQHLVGMQSADLIIAINKNPEAPMMKLADYSIVGDVFEVLPAMMKEIRRT